MRIVGLLARMGRSTLHSVPILARIRILVRTSPESQDLNIRDYARKTNQLGKPVESWSENDVALWLYKGSLKPPEDLVEALHDHAITGAVLLSLSESDLNSLAIKKFGH